MRRPRGIVVTLVAWLALAAALLGPLASSATAEEIHLDELNVTIQYDQRNQRVAERVENICRRDLGRIAGQLGLETIAPIEIRVVDDMRPYRQALGSHLPVWGVAFALMGQQQIIVDVDRATRAFNSLLHVIPHELSHLLVAQRVGKVNFPIWFVEGLAQWQASEWSMVDSWQLMNAVWSRTAPPLVRLVDQYPLAEDQARTAYRVSYVAFTEMFDGHMERLPEFLGLVEETGSFGWAFERFTGMAANVYMAEFQTHLRQRYHSRLLVFQNGPLFGILSVIFLFVGLRLYLRKRSKLKDLARLEDPLSLDDPQNPGV